jgi:large subunit ribosomal protein L17
MRHRVAGKKLSRNSGQRKALRVGLATSLLTYGRIQTTQAKADFIRGHVERIITIAKRGLAKTEATQNVGVGVHARRIAASHLNNDRVLVQKLFDVIAPVYKDRPGGYTRTYKIGPRKGDNAPMVLIELIDYPTEETASASAS